MQDQQVCFAKEKAVLFVFFSFFFFFKKKNHDTKCEVDHDENSKYELHT